MAEKRSQIVTDNSEETLEIINDGERFALVSITKGMFPDWRSYKTIVFNSKEAQEIVKFIKGK